IFAASCSCLASSARSSSARPTSAISMFVSRLSAAAAATGTAGASSPPNPSSAMRIGPRAIASPYHVEGARRAPSPLPRQPLPELHAALGDHAQQGPERQVLRRGFDGLHGAGGREVELGGDDRPVGDEATVGGELGQELLHR